jgi:hypothetical protein
MTTLVGAARAAATAAGSLLDDPIGQVDGQALGELHDGD